MNKKRIQLFLLILAGIGLVGGLFFKLRLLDIDQAIINYGSQTVRMYQTLGNVLLGIFVLALLLVVGVQLTVKAKTARTVKEQAQAKKHNPNYDEADVIAKLTSLAQQNVSYESELRQADQLISQINGCLEDLKELQVSNDYELLEKINYSMIQAKTQILQNAKSIINRVTIEGDRQEINKRLENSGEIVQQVKGLLNETVNYLDSKSPSTKADLESMTKALKTLNKTIE
ncbi:hypothetical protein [Enterococcus sp. BWR-S5]|uniref:hypothetical protein n=1 Tax=Enterococcus sp. BWR-S5 TaxID=2787714 RepID=UPI00192345F1|nr:hypothetical protein [Enterococcus sp. BWR-S5]MBL1224339.1 hypothetical protein [Enterococcus sp. BWR-S5]